MFKKSLVLLLLVILLLPAVSAFQAYVYPVTDESNQIYFDEIAKYELKLVNDLSTDVVYTVYLNPVEWSLITDSSILVKGNESKIIPFEILPKPSTYHGPGTHYIPVTIKANNGGTYDTQITLFIKSFKESYGEYLPAISLATNVRDEIDPSKDMNVELLLRNRNILNIENMTLSISSDLFSKEDIVNLSGLAENRLQYKFTIPSTTTPGQYKLNVKAFYQGKTLSDVQSVFDVVTVSLINREKEEMSYWFKNVKTSKITNDGNVPKEVSTTLDSAWYVKLFSSVDVEANQVEKSKGEWIIYLEPGESAKFIVTENYRYLIFLIVLLVLIAGLYFIFRSPLVIHKQIVVTGQDGEGISEMKVRIFVINRTSKAYYNLRLIDNSPSIATVSKNTSFGVLQPDKIIPTDKKGTIIKWDVESLEAYEERIFTYNLKARLKIIGNLSLPGVKAKFEDVKGKERTVISAKAVIGEKV